MKILIPTYEPSKNIIKLIEDLQSLTSVPIIVINDGSGEQYNNIFDKLRKSGVTVLSHDINRGKGQALKTGIEYLIKIGEEQGCVCADSDGQHKPKDIIKIIKELEKNQEDIILGVRNFKQNNIPFRSKFGNNISKILFYIMTGTKITDTQTGLRGYSSNIFKWLINIEGSRYEYEFNILLQLKEDNIKFKEIKIETIYEDNNKVSHFKPFRDSILIYKPICKFLISSIISFLIDFGLLLIFEHIIKNLLLAVVLSRSISSIFNFICNKNYVFKSKNNILQEVIKYYILVIIIMLLNYSILNLLYTILNINLIIAKILTEIILYTLSFIIQKRIIFK